MSDLPLPCLRTHGSGLLLQVLVRPRCSRNRIEGLQADALKLSLTAPPVEGIANQACLELLAHHLGLRPSQLRIRAGFRSHRKLIALEGCTLPAIQERLRSLLGPRAVSNQRGISATEGKTKSGR